MITVINKESPEFAFTFLNSHEGIPKVNPVALISKQQIAEYSEHALNGILLGLYPNVKLLLTYV